MNIKFNITKIGCKGYYNKSILKRLIHRCYKLAISKLPNSCNIPIKINKNICYELSIIIVNKKTMKILNFKFRRKTYLTDVLSFPYNKINNQKIDKFLGEIFIYPPKFYNSNLKYKNNEMLFHNLIHSLLHLLGYDHQKLYHKKTMYSLENKIAHSLNINKLHLNF